MKKLPPLEKEARLYDIVQKGVESLGDVQAYKQSNLVKKLGLLKKYKPMIFRQSSKFCARF